MVRIELDAVSKSYRTGVLALDSVSMRVRAGEIYGLVGLNGAGKTTLMRVLLGMVQPTSGKCFLNGSLIGGAGYRHFHDVGYMIETPEAYPELTVRENLHIFAELRLRDDPERINSVLEGLKLKPYQKTKAKHLSLGNKQRLGLAKALMHEPDILLLDEPLNGLDPKGRKEMRDLLLSLAEQGVAILISSHLLPEMTEVANRIGIIHNGKLLQEISSSLPKRLILQTIDDDRAVKVLQGEGYRVKRGVHEIYLTEEKVLKKPEKIAKLLVEHNIAPKQLWTDQQTLEDYFLAITKEETP